MNDIICIILIFFLLGLIVNHFRPLIEGLNECESTAETSLTGRDKQLGKEGKLDDDKQKEYNDWVKKEEDEKDRIYKNKNCLRSLINKNDALVKAFKEDDFDPINKKYKGELKPSSKSFQNSKKKFNKDLNALYDMVADGDDGDEPEDKEEQTVGEINDPAGASPNEDIGKPIDTEGAAV